jgi:DNA modification methylase
LRFSQREEQESHGSVQETGSGKEGDKLYPMIELIWKGKYVDGKKQNPVRVALPFQTVETVNESAADRQRNLELFSSGRQTEWRNRLIWGDNKYVLPSLLPEFAGKVNLIYIDPPFTTGQDFSFNATIPNYPADDDDPTVFTKQPSIIEQKAYRDTWGAGDESYLQVMYERLTLMRELLNENGTIYVHCDWRKNSALRLILDEVFGSGNFMNEVIWKRDSAAKGAKKTSRQWSREGDNILVYRKEEGAFFTQVYITELTDTQLREYMYEDPDGRKFKKVTLGDYSEQSIEQFRKQNLIYKTSSGREYKKYYLDEARFAIGSIWTDIVNLSKGQHEQVGYLTQKPEELLDRIIRASSQEGDLVLDCFAGSGTTAVAAEKLNRRWIACDLSRFAIHTTRKRLLSVQGVNPFSVQNLGKYERQAWQVAEFQSGEADALEQQRLRETAYRKFILDLYRSTPIGGYQWLHGLKSGRMVHVGAVDAPVTLTDVKAIAREVWKAASAGGAKKAAVDILGWEFAFELNETAREIAAQSRVDVTFKKIPREVLEKKAIEQGDIKFFELGALSVETKVSKHEVMIKLTDFVIPIDDVPEDVRKEIKHWSQMIDYWAVDWNFKGDTFHNQWQSYRTRKQPKLELSTKYEYPAQGKYKMVVKVIDILGNDTTRTLDVEVK